jgi:hypothetical protein
MNWETIKNEEMKGGSNNVRLEIAASEALHITYALHTVLS